MRLKPMTRAALCAAALSLAALAAGCLRQGPAPAGGQASTRPDARATPAQSSPVQTAQPAPSPTVESPLPPPRGFVNDFAGVIDDGTEELLEAKLGLLRERARIEFAVVTVETTGARDIKDYSLAVARGWGVGPPAGEEGGGLLLLFSIKERRWRLQVSERLRGDLPDDVAAELSGVMTPSLRAEHYGEAATRYVDELVKRLAERRGFSTKE